MTNLMYISFKDDPEDAVALPHEQNPDTTAKMILANFINSNFND